MNIIGIDPSLTGTGIVCLEDGDYVDSKVVISKYKDINRLIDIREQIRIFMFKNKNIIHSVVIEGFAFGARGMAMFDLGMLSGILRAFIMESNLKLLVIQPTMLKKFVTGKGNVHKDLMLMNVYKKWKIDFTEFKGQANNVCDAFGLAQIGWSKYCIDNDMKIKLTKEQKEVIEKISKEQEVVRNGKK